LRRKLPACISWGFRADVDVTNSPSHTKDLTILAVTKMHGGVCTAGIDQSGNWIRPVRPASEQRSLEQSITDYCLLPIDFFHGGKSHLVSMGITRFWLAAHQPAPPHTEDWTIDLTRKPQSIGKLSTDEQADFLAAHVEADLDELDPSHERSLGLYRPSSFEFSFGLNRLGEDVAVRATFRVGGRQMVDVGCTDLKVRALGRLLLQKAGGSEQVLTNDDFRRRGKQETYLAVGLSRLYRNKHWPIIVGVHSIPELEVEIDYAKL
jgi:hypothetical protein